MLSEQQFNREVGARVRRTRLAAALTQADLARATQLSRASITNIEAGSQAPPPYRLALLAAALGVEPADLLPSVQRFSSLPEHVNDAVASVASAAQAMRSADGAG